jgi:hemoglobin
MNLLRPTLYEQVGGMPFFEGLVERFYQGVETDPVLRPLYPEDDLSGARRRLQLFLAQYWGGPGTYSDERGHPRLRMRHAPFPVDEAARDAWLHHMRAAVEGAELRDDLRASLLDYFEQAASFMINTQPPPA